MADISRIASPMSLCEEDLFDVDRKVEARRKLLEKLQKEKPAGFLVGNIEKVNQRISSLDEELSQYDSQLVIDGRGENNAEKSSRQVVSRNNFTSHSSRDREEKKVSEFAGVYKSKSFTSDEVANTYSKKTTSSGPTKKRDTPRLVELQQFPGWNDKQYLPLPHFIETSNVLDHVVAAQWDLKRKPFYRHEFIRLIYSKIQRSILQDVFWWFFLHKYHPDPQNQSNFFKRVSINFVRLLLHSENERFRNVFFLSYGSILAQSIYSAFCLAFPQSWNQFDDESFKEMLSQTCGEWVSGIRPPPRAYEVWNISELEPEGMRKEDVIKPKKKDKERRFFTGRISPSSSAASTKASTALSRSGSYRTASLRLPTAKSEGKSSGASPKLTPRVAELISDRNLLSPISEVPNVSTAESTVTTRIKPDRSRKDSCVAGRGPEFSRNIFNVCGRSPLLDQFSRHHGLERKTGYDVLVRHTLVSSFPARNSKTYQDIISESRQRMNTVTSNFRKRYEETIRLNTAYSSRQRHEKKVFRNRVDNLLTKPHQVHYLSNLILLEMKKESDDVNTVGAAAALQNALMAESE